MTTWLRGALWLVWLTMAAALWHMGALRTGAALAAGLLSTLLLVWPSTASRRRRSSLQYVEMGKDPVGQL
ncbi:hypothetical protein WKW77_33015 [Variovorax ureilyticus]|uniref:Uncharacterized protein n=1 Tax=Variovorax ureilyticus TaxID=1836198 RepID=A0ABU8VQI2_9BURK